MGELRFGEPRFRSVARLADEHLVHTLRRLHADIGVLEGDLDEEVDAAMAACVQLASEPPVVAPDPVPAEPDPVHVATPAQPPAATTQPQPRRKPKRKRRRKTKSKPAAKDRDRMFPSSME